MSKALRLVKITVEHQMIVHFYLISNHKNLFPKYLDSVLTDLA